MIANAENLVNAKIDEVMKDLAISKLNGLKSAMHEYKQAIEGLKNDPNNTLESDKITQIPAVKAVVIIGNNI
ncbi:MULTISPECIES: hypothetical protein [Bacillus cereus group]|uniref:hypothetical protein n=1 Tax=Bacillus TaxID=1386 RepID=UPI0001A1D328|nr:hypothetical protein [Bacillus thuringiensis]EEM68670.1 hypothetical protein bthur0009_53130 [Bacillus thuringiensis serovar andalousiensis BGSC 4AW1]OUB04091.1 hypothetical protein BK714_00860 [Bacillus thuringiensis serovar oswaldocruzi]